MAKCPFCGATGRHWIVPGGVNARILAHNGVVLAARLFYPVVHAHPQWPRLKFHFIPWLRGCRACGRRFVSDAEGAYATTCWQCGYDLSGNTSGTCPDCGRRLAPVQRAILRQRGADEAPAAP